jgi:hypothetical protein
VGQFEAGLRQAQPERFKSWSIPWISPLALSLSKGERFKLTHYPADAAIG